MVTPYYSDEDTTLYRGDCLDVLASLDSGIATVMCLDPPYSSGARQAAQMINRGALVRRETRWMATDNLSSHGFAMLSRLVAVEGFRVTRQDGHWLSFIDWRQWPVLAGAVESAGWNLRSCVVWDKKTFGLGPWFRQQCEFVMHASKGAGDNFERHDVGTVVRSKRVTGDHPTMKPVDLLTTLLSAAPTGLVVDPFAGSGATLLAARALGRPSIGIELDGEYCDLIVDRLRQRSLFSERCVARDAAVWEGDGVLETEPIMRNEPIVTPGDADK